MKPETYWAHIGVPSSLGGGRIPLDIEGEHGLVIELFLPEVFLAYIQPFQYGLQLFDA